MLSEDFWAVRDILAFDLVLGWSLWLVIAGVERTGCQSKLTPTHVSKEKLEDCYTSPESMDLIA